MPQGSSGKLTLPVSCSYCIFSPLKALCLPHAQILVLSLVLQRCSLYLIYPRIWLLVLHDELWLRLPSYISLFTAASFFLVSALSFPFAQLLCVCWGGDCAEWQ